MKSLVSWLQLMFDWRSKIFFKTVKGHLKYLVSNNSMKGSSWIILCHRVSFFYLLFGLRFRKIPWKNKTKVFPFKQIRGFVNSNQHTLEYNQLAYLQGNKYSFYCFFQTFFYMHNVCIIKAVLGPTTLKMKAALYFQLGIIRCPTRDLAPEIIDSGPMCITDLFQNKYLAKPKIKYFSKI